MKKISVIKKLISGFVVIAFVTTSLDLPSIKEGKRIPQAPHYLAPQTAIPAWLPGKKSPQPKTHSKKPVEFVKQFFEPPATLSGAKEPEDFPLLLKDFFSQEEAQEILDLRNPAQAEALIPDYVPNDSYVRLQTRDLIQCMHELIANAQDTQLELYLREKLKLSGEELKRRLKTIGRFGVGALQMFAELQNENQAIVLQSRKQGSAEMCIYLFYLREGQIVFNSRAAPAKAKGKPEFPCGTKITVLKNLSPAEMARRQQSIRDHFHLNIRSRIELVTPRERIASLYNGAEYHFLNSRERPHVAAEVKPVRVRMNSNGYCILDEGMGLDAGEVKDKILTPKSEGKGVVPETKQEQIEEVQVFFKPAEENQEAGRIGVWLNGRRIFAIQAEGAQVSPEAHFIFPHNASTTEGWLNIEVDSIAVTAIRAMVDKLTDPKREVPNRAGLIQSLVSLIEYLQPEETVGAEGDLMAYLRQKTEAWIASLGPEVTVVPNEKEWRHVKLPEKVIFVSPKLIPSAEKHLARLPQMDAAAAQQLELQDVRIYLGEFAPEAATTVLRGRDEKGKWILLDKKVWESQKENPKLLAKRLSLIAWPPEKTKREEANDVKSRAKKETRLDWAAKWLNRAAVGLIAVLSLYFYLVGNQWVDLAPKVEALENAPVVQVKTEPIHIPNFTPPPVPPELQPNLPTPPNQATPSPFLYRQSPRDPDQFFGSGPPTPKWNPETDFLKVPLAENPSAVIAIEGPQELIKDVPYTCGDFDFLDGTGTWYQNSQLEKRGEESDYLGTLHLKTTGPLTIRAGGYYSLLCPWNGVVDRASVKLLDSEGKLVPFEWVRSQIIPLATGNFSLEWDVKVYREIRFERIFDRLPEQESADLERVFGPLFFAQTGKTLEELRRAPERERLQALYQVMQNYFTYNPGSAYEFNGRSWSSTFETIFQRDGKMGLVCSGTAQYFCLLGRALSLSTIFHTAEIPENGRFYSDRRPHASASIRIDGKWISVETTGLVPYVDAVPNTAPNAMSLPGNYGWSVKVIKPIELVLGPKGLILGLIFSFLFVCTLLYRFALEKIKSRRIKIRISIIIPCLIILYLNFFPSISLNLMDTAIAFAKNSLFVSGLIFLANFFFKVRDSGKSPPSLLIGKNVLVVNRSEEKKGQPPRGIYFKGELAAPLDSQEMVFSLKSCGDFKYALIDRLDRFGALFSPYKLYRIDPSGKVEDILPQLPEAKRWEKIGFQKVGDEIYVWGYYRNFWLKRVPVRVQISPDGKWSQIGEAALNLALEKAEKEKTPPLVGDYEFELGDYKFVSTNGKLKRIDQNGNELKSADIDKLNEKKHAFLGVSKGFAYFIFYFHENNNETVQIWRMDKDFNLTKLKFVDVKDLIQESNNLHYIIVPTLENTKKALLFISDETEKAGLLVKHENYETFDSLAVEQDSDGKYMIGAGVINKQGKEEVVLLRNGEPYSLVDADVDVKKNKKTARYYRRLIELMIKRDYRKTLLQPQLKTIRDWTPFHLAIAYDVDRRDISAEVFAELWKRLVVANSTFAFLMGAGLLLSRVEDPLPFYDRWVNLPEDLKNKIVRQLYIERYLVILRDESLAQKYSEEGQIYARILKGESEYVLSEQEDFINQPELEDLLVKGKTPPRGEMSDFLLEELVAAGKRFPKKVKIASLEQVERARACAANPKLLRRERVAIAKTVNNQDKAGRLYIREWVQNARDALLEERQKTQSEETPKVEARSYLRKREGKEEWVFSVADSFGMNLDILVRYLLTPDATTKRRLPKELALFLADGLFGQGFFTGFAGGSQVRVITGSGGKTYEAILQPLYDENENVVEIQVVSFKEFDVKFKGSVIERIHTIREALEPQRIGVKTFTLAQAMLEHAYVRNLLGKYCGAVRDVDLTWNAVPLRGKREVLAEEAGIELLEGDLSKGRICLNGLYVEDLKDVYLACADLPAWLRKLVYDRRLIFNFPKGTLPVRSRTALYQPEQFQEPIRNLLFKWVLKEYEKKALAIPGLPDRETLLKQADKYQPGNLPQELYPLLTFKPEPGSASLWEELEQRWAQIEKEKSETRAGKAGEGWSEVYDVYLYLVLELYREMLREEAGCPNLWLEQDASQLRTQMQALDQFLKSGAPPFDLVLEMVELLVKDSETRTRLLDRILRADPLWKKWRAEGARRLGANAEDKMKKGIESLEKEGEKERWVIRARREEYLWDQLPTLAELLTREEKPAARLRAVLRKISPHEAKNVRARYLRDAVKIEMRRLFSNLTPLIDTAI